MLIETAIAVVATAILSVPALAAPFQPAQQQQQRPPPPPIRSLVARAPSTFQHPGVLLNGSQLDLMASRVNAGAQPWASAYAAMVGSSLGSPTRAPSPFATVECGPTSAPDVGCTAERQDALAAYAMALAWRVTGAAQYAQSAIAYMDAWAATLVAHADSNAPLQTGWAGSTWARAAEIIRHSDAGWPQADVEAFADMLRNVYLPEVIGGSDSNGNWELVMMEAAIGISVFLDDSDSYDQAMDIFLARVPAYIYLTTDGEYPASPRGEDLSDFQIVSLWYGQDTFPTSGIAQETCRDLTHTGYGISSISHVCETSKIQGTDLYTQDTGTRLRYALGFHTQFDNGVAVPSWLCNGALNGDLGPVPEVGYNALAVRLGYSMTNTHEYTVGGRPWGTNYLFVGWETLTHALTSS